jgi:hypothetical protein
LARHATRAARAPEHGSNTDVFDRN